ncbi:MAG: GNAT family N-acetyltransferase [Vicinamibacterales bacterium]|jgi:aminoglycoside 6'-N-acetyltransferase I|nr:AAC(6')-I family aminoglycoside N-acetyltransferase [Acidobacteriota bacterium]MDP6372141.1 GNAT family N-acetyltransferase [Vicinamibacterales bacterium]MDP6608818.1 GNAT family N-acetyltransferase [Vicinamibacterales bacterium]HAK53923.1 AAC(6')-I family aminoglycoside N-acetyltransferase [Acidobacteriota bacterium]|tara:strand:- start:5347 stop:5796 length:450 start_codon:yes stop_codon:yes gene_type:complete
MVAIRPVEADDAAAWLAMRRELWPESSEAEHRDEIDQFLAGRSLEPAAVLLAEDVDARPLGFAELSVRHYAEGCRTQRVAYLEGWFVRPGTRQRGVGRNLVAAAEAWGRDQGCIEFASDADPDNTASIAAHRALGFDDVGLVRCFRKNL